MFLLANYWSCVKTTIDQRVHDEEGDPLDPASAGKRLEKMRRKILAKQIVLLSQLRQNSAFTAFEPTFGGKFPKKSYDAIIVELSK
jgi:hypothetical protein